MILWNNDTHQLDQFYCHPVVTAVHKQFEQSRSEGQEIVGPPPSKLAHYIHDGGRDTWVLILSHQAFFDLRPCCS